MPNVVITTTMWGKVDDEEGDQREEELKNDFWKEMVAQGCKTERFDNTYESAWRIIGSVARKAGIPSEILDSGPRAVGISAKETASKQLELEAFTSKLGRIFSR